MLKRFGPGDPGPAVVPDARLDPRPRPAVGHDGLDRLLDDLDEQVLAAGGRVYLAKDSRLAPDTFRAMYPRVDDFLEVRARSTPTACCGPTSADGSGSAPTPTRCPTEPGGHPGPPDEPTTTEEGPP